MHDVQEVNNNPCDLVDWELSAWLTGPCMQTLVPERVCVPEKTGTILHAVAQARDCIFNELREGIRCPQPVLLQGSGIFMAATLSGIMGYKLKLKTEGIATHLCSSVSQSSHLRCKKYVS